MAAVFKFTSVAWARLYPQPAAAPGDYDTAAVASVVRMEAAWITDRLLYTPDPLGVDPPDLPVRPFPAGQLYLPIGQFLRTGQSPQEPGVPPIPYFLLDSDGTLVVDDTTWHPAIYVGASADNLGAARVRFSAIGVNPNMVVRVEVQIDRLLTEAITGWSAASNNYSPRRKLLYASRTQTTELSLDTGSPYGAAGWDSGIGARFLPQGQDAAVPGNWSFSQARLSAAPRWYNLDPLGAAGTGVTDMQFQLLDGISPVTSLSAYRDYLIRLQWSSQGLAVAPDCRVTLMCIRTDQATQGITPLSLYQHEICTLSDQGCGGGGPNFYANTGVIESGLPWLLGSQKIFMGPALGPAQATVGSWNARTALSGAGLAVDGRYRFIATVYVSRHPEGDFDRPEAYSFISDEFSVSGIPALCPPDVQAVFTDYKIKASGLNMLAAPQERVQSSVVFSAASYDVCRQAPMTPFLSALRSVTCRVYTLEGDWQHVLERYSFTRSLLGIWSPVLANAAITEDSVANTFSIALALRLRYEANIPNLSSVNTVTGVISPTPLSNQDWTDRTIWVEYELELVQSSPQDFTDRLIVRHHVQVHDYDTECMQIAFLDPDTDAPILTLCDTREHIKVRVTNCDLGPFDFLALIDKEIYGIANVREGDGWDGELPRLEQPPFLVIDAAFDPVTKIAEAILDATLLDMGKQYRVAAIRKSVGAGPIPCGSEGANSAQGVRVTEHAIGDPALGPPIIAYDAYGGSDSINVYEGAGGTATGTPLFYAPGGTTLHGGSTSASMVQFQGIIVLPAATTPLLDIAVDNIPHIPPSQFGYRVFCCGDPGVTCDGAASLHLPATGFIGDQSPCDVLNGYIGSPPHPDLANCPVFNALLLAAGPRAGRKIIPWRLENLLTPDFIPYVMLSAYAVSGGSYNLMADLYAQRQAGVPLASLSSPAAFDDCNHNGVQNGDPFLQYGTIWHLPNSLTAPPAPNVYGRGYTEGTRAAGGFFVVDCAADDRIVVCATLAKGPAALFHTQFFVDGVLQPARLQFSCGVLGCSDTPPDPLAVDLVSPGLDCLLNLYR